MKGINFGRGGVLNSASFSKIFVCRGERIKVTRSYLHEIDCPDCGSKQNTKIFESINVSVNPELKEELFQGRINLFRCKSCGNEASIPAALLYHDMTKRFCVQFYPFNWLERDNFLENFTKEGGLNIGLWMKISKHSKYMERTHIVFEMSELVRYVIFRDKLHEKWGKAS